MAAHNTQVVWRVKAILAEVELAKGIMAGVKRDLEVQQQLQVYIDHTTATASERDTRAEGHISGR